MDDAPTWQTCSSKARWVTGCKGSSWGWGETPGKWYETVAALSGKRRGERKKKHGLGGMGWVRSQREGEKRGRCSNGYMHSMHQKPPMLSPVLMGRHLQLAQNTAVYMLTRASRFHYITPILWDSHWLPIVFRALQDTGVDLL